MDEYDAMYEEQEGLCYLCCEYFEVLHIDHCHQTKRVRKLLCFVCNTRLSWIENRRWLKRALRYLRDHSEPKV